MKNLGNTINLTNLFEVGEIIFLEENSDFAFEVVSPYNVKPLFGESVKPVKLATGVKNALKEITGVSPTYFKPAELVVNSENLTLVEVGELKNISVPNNIKKSTGSIGEIPLNYQTVYSHLRSADDVVRSDIPEAVGYNSKSAALWNDYLDGGRGALNNTTLSNQLLTQFWESNCCGSYSKVVAGITLCSKCGGEFVCSALTEGA